MQNTRFSDRLLECKCREKAKDNLVDVKQVRGHAKYFNWDWEGLDRRALGSQLLELTWYDVLEVIDKAIGPGGALPADLSPNEQDKTVLEDLKEFLGFFPYDYRLFRGFQFSELPPPPGWRLCHKADERTSR